MSLFDRFTSQKGKDAKSAPKAKVTPKAKKNDEAEKKAFAAVPSGESTKPAVVKADKADKKAATAAPVAKASTGQSFRVLLSAIVTEKSSRQAKNSQYSFMIAPGINKTQVRDAVQHLYGIQPVAVNITNLPGKVIRYGRTYGRSATRKKAVVTLPAGKTIDVTNS